MEPVWVFISCKEGTPEYSVTGKSITEAVEKVSAHMGMELASNNKNSDSADGPWDIYYKSSICYKFEPPKIIFKCYRVPALS